MRPSDPVVYQREVMRDFFDLGYSVEEVPFTGGEGPIELIVRKPIPTNDFAEGIIANIQLFQEYSTAEDARIGNPNIRSMNISRYKRNVTWEYKNDKEPEYDSQQVTLLKRLFDMSPREVIDNRLEEDKEALVFFETIQLVTK
jgi:hypothetical protein